MSASSLKNDPLDARALARARRAAMLRRARRIRRAVAGLAVALFAAMFLVVYVQLASGHDPALVANAAKRSAASPSVTSTEASAAESSTSAEAAEASTATESSAASESSTGSEESSSGASAVTTSQS
jgi:hypothetical protein